jgi:alanyl-tRNA synthetase
MTRLHTATHLLHQALRDTLGEGVRQMGSDINPERTRFDFSFDRKLTDEELRTIEAIVNAKIREDLPVRREVMPYQEAIRQGALAFFKEKYPQEVSVYSIGSYSKELCGGPHVRRTGEIGRFTILKEEAVGRGVRRIRATIEPDGGIPTD